MSAFIGGPVANAAPDDQRPQMFTAVQPMLKLERARGTVDLIVVERVERPSVNRSVIPRAVPPPARP